MSSQPFAPGFCSSGLDQKSGVAPDAGCHRHGESERSGKAGFTVSSLLKAAAVSVAAAAVIGGADALAAEWHSGGPYVPTPQAVVDKMLKLARVGPDDFVVDLGSGDGRIVLTAAARYGARGLGVELDGELVALSNREARRLGVEKLVSFRQEDALKANFREATVVTLYLLPELLNPLRDRILRELRPGTRVVAHDFPFLDWPPDRSVTLEVDEKYGKPGTWQSNLFLWIVPARVDGYWRAALSVPESREFTLALTQKFQRIEGYATIGAERVSLEDAAVEGRGIRFTIPDMAGGGGSRLEFIGVVDGEVIRGTALSPRGTLHWQARRADSRTSHAP